MSSDAGELSRVGVINGSGSGGDVLGMGANAAGWGVGHGVASTDIFLQWRNEYLSGYD